MTDTTYSRDMPKTRYVSTNLTPVAYAAVRQLALRQSMESGKRVTMSAVVTALTELANKHEDEFNALITGTEDTSDD
jgi:hypothetical protein